MTKFDLDTVQALASNRKEITNKIKEVVKRFYADYTDWHSTKGHIIVDISAMFQTVDVDVITAKRDLSYDNFSAKYMIGEIESPSYAEVFDGCDLSFLFSLEDEVEDLQTVAKVVGGKAFDSKAKSIINDCAYDSLIDALATTAYENLVKLVEGSEPDEDDE